MNSVLNPIRTVPFVTSSLHTILSGSLAGVVLEEPEKK